MRCSGVANAQTITCAPQPNGAPESIPNAGMGQASTATNRLALPERNPRGVFHPLSLSPPPVGFSEAGVEILGRGPGPARLGIHGGAVNVLVLLAFAFRPGLD